MTRRLAMGLVGAAMLVVVLAAALLWRGAEAPAAAGAEGGRSYAGLGAPALDGFAAPKPGAPIRFPRDLGPHPDYRIEWWYLTANLTGADGETYGVQWTLFRQALAPGPQRAGWESQQFWLGHAAVTTAGAHYFDQRLGRGGVGQAGAEAGPDGVAAWVDHWRLDGAALGADGAPSRYQLSADGPGFAYALELVTDQPIALQGEGGYSVKSDRGQASYYYSQPFFTVAGALTLEGRAIPVSGLGWMDREWSSQPLAPDQEGWDWFSLHLDSGEKAMLFRLRHSDGGHYFSGNWITAEGGSTPIPRQSIAMAPMGWTAIDGRRVPTAWRLEIAGRDLAIETAPLNPSSWSGGGFAYWEGPIRLSGSHGGVGYLEMTGY